MAPAAVFRAGYIESPNAIIDRSKSRIAAISEVEVEDLPDSAETGAELDEIEHRARLFKLVERLPIDQSRVIVMDLRSRNRSARLRPRSRARRAQSSSFNSRPADLRVRLG